MQRFEKKNQTYAKKFVKWIKLAALLRVILELLLPCSATYEYILRRECKKSTKEEYFPEIGCIIFFQLMYFAKQHSQNKK